MNWYKSALKKEAITYQDFFKFYAYSAIPNEVFENNPVLLYDFIEHLNNIREYYLETLLKEVGEELNHWGQDNVKYQNIDFFKQHVIPLANKFIKSGNLTYSDFAKAKGLFNMDIYNGEIYKFKVWDDWYGGEAWTMVTEWIQKLYFFGNIEQVKSSNGLIHSAKKLAFIIDTIHSLEHNTNLVLRELPEQEKRWMIEALETTKKALEPSQLAYLSEDPDLMKLYKKDILMPSGLQTESPTELSEEFYEFYEESQKVFTLMEEQLNLTRETKDKLRLTEDPDVMKAGLLAGMYNAEYAVRNPLFLEYVDEILHFILRHRLFHIADFIFKTIAKQNMTHAIDINQYIPYYVNASDLNYLEKLIVQYPEVDISVVNSVLQERGFDSLWGYLYGMNVFETDSFHYFIDSLVSSGNKKMFFELLKHLTAEQFSEIFGYLLGNSYRERYMNWADEVYEQYEDRILPTLKKTYWSKKRGEA